MRYKKLPPVYIEKNRIFVWGFWVVFVCFFISVFLFFFSSGLFNKSNELISQTEPILKPEGRVKFLGSLSIDGWDFYIVREGNHTGWTYRMKDIYLVYNNTFSDTHTTCCHEICHNYLKSLEENNLSQYIGSYFIDTYNMSIGQGAEEQMCHEYSASCEEPVCDKLITMLRSYQK